MTNLKIFLSMFCVLHIHVFVNSIEFEVIRWKVDYVNPKICDFANVTIKRTSRKSPYYLNMDIKTKVIIGNNCTVKFMLSEYISGRFIPLPFVMTYKLCDGLLNDPLFGSVIAPQLNSSCPFPIGEYRFHDVKLQFPDFPYVPFTYSGSWTNMKLQANFEFPEIKEIAANASGIFKIIQHEKNERKERGKKNKN